MKDNSYKYLWKISQYIDINQIKIGDTDKKIDILDEWIIAKCKNIQDEFLYYINQKSYDKAKEILDNFLINDFYSVYKELLDINLDDKSRRNVFAIIYAEILEMYYDFIPEIVDYIYFNLYEYTDKDLFEEDYLSKYDIDSKILVFGEAIKKVVLAAKAYRIKNHIAKNESISTINLNVKKDDNRLLIAILNELLQIINARTYNITFTDNIGVDFEDNSKRLEKVG